ncbi:amino acid deaminase [Silvibacterium dinghuense]|uniref:Amino acid deaminase n=2 Tax=Silvibacterium dinghuense TaxID=1560006 RepID=A0A4Q1SK51_9BACT|nr:amino acid deaminase [Silvibacterium dinghuense]
MAALHWNILREDVSLPCAVLYEERLEHNLKWMQRFIEEYGVKLAPHGKTTMTPKLFARQIAGGAWGITLATAQQALAAYEHGIRRVLMMNQLVGRQNMEAVSRLLEDPAFDFYCLVDSAAQIEQLGTFFHAKRQRVQVLLEVGIEGGRAGVRNAAQIVEVLAALARWKDTLALRGVELFEGLLKEESAVRSFLERATAVMRQLLAEKHLAPGKAILTGAGSAWYDVVAEVFTGAGFGEAVEIVLRPGCYLTHDVGAYREAQERILATNPIAQKLRAGLLPAQHVWSYVQSVPEAERAILGMGKRDAAFDAGLPEPALHYRPGEDAPRTTPAHWKLAKMMDQHAYLDIQAGDDIRPGDMIACDVAHPCLTFDKWRTLLVVNTHYDVIDVVETYF